VPGSWRRGVDAQLYGRRYRRSDVDRPNTGEHAIEYQILEQHFNSVQCLGGKVVDGINAMPLAGDTSGRRFGNVEADLFLLIEKDKGYHLVLGEVKDTKNNAWYAAIENLRQLKLMVSSAAARQLFQCRKRDICLPTDMPVIGLVIAPAKFYLKKGQKANAVPNARELLRDFTAKTKDSGTSRELGS
jgi:hypothetical protein